MTPFECVPNFSEGRDEGKIRRIADAARAVPGVAVLDVEWNADHNRTVITLVGDGDALLDAVLGMMTIATEVIDLTHHTGEHPRMGATDVVPFVPLAGATVEDAVRLAGRMGERVWKELGIPVYFYGSAARRPDRVDLPSVRQGEFEGIREEIGKNPARAPDIGEPRVHPTAGAVAIGARPVLIAFNAYLTTPDVAIAKKIAKAVRARDGGLTEVRALGFEIKERDRAQVSMNLTDYRKTPIHRALEQVRREAERFGAGVEESEIVGVVPEDALFDAAEFYLQLNRFDRATILERKVRTVASSMPGGESLASFAGRLAARTPTPGGGSASAAAAAFGAALGEMVLSYSILKAQPDPELVAVRAECTAARAAFLKGIEEDSRAYDAVQVARKALKDHAEDAALKAAHLAAVRGAAEVPLETARRAQAIARRLRGVQGRTKAALASDVVTALALLRAATEGALENVVINLADLKAAGEEVGPIEAEVTRLRLP
ncbi:MAG: glutamate formimidoyltransferase [Thermoplasmata archaeon]|jgi:glutamate formiminotransferase/formiminotetrahydrofolate cyclodeaminase